MDDFSLFLLQHKLYSLNDIFKLKTNVIDEVNFLYADNHNFFQQIVNVTFDGYSQVFQCLYNMSVKKLEMKFDFAHADKHQSFHQGDTITIDGHAQAFSKCSK